MPNTNDAGPTLTNITFMGRQAVKYSLILVIALMAGRTFLNAFTTFWKATHPPKAAPPSVGFGVLPPIAFPEQKASEKPQAYELETKTGRFPEFQSKVSVFFMPGFTSSLFDDENARAIASSFGFVFEPEILDTQTYRFTKSSPLLSTLDMNIRSKTFDLKTDYLARQDLFVGSQVPDTQTAIAGVKDVLKEAGLDLDLLTDASVSAQASYVKAEGNNLVAADSISDAEFVQVDLKRAPIEDLEMYTPMGREGTVHAVFTGAFDGRDALVRLRNRHYPIEKTQEETYPLRTVSSAWNVLQAGEGYIAAKGELNTAVVRYVYLGYYDSFDYQPYLQPIYVFEGDKGFLGYVSAIDPKYIQAKEEPL